MKTQNSNEILRKILTTTTSIPSKVYAPSDDTFLMIDAIATLSIEGKEVLDLGTGSGLLGLYCALHSAHVTASDIDEAAINHTANAARLLGVELKLVVSDLFSNVPGQFDLILFNPPYLPSKDIHDKTVDGGHRGTVVINRFLRELPLHLRTDGEALLLVSSFNSPEALPQTHNMFDFSTIAERALFFEELKILRVRLRNDLSI
ncbi:MAG: HemK2/MTQ2 family protein methyltransferase [Candidatus Bathyarchaeia archaeon]